MNTPGRSKRTATSTKTCVYVHRIITDAHGGRWTQNVFSSTLWPFLILAETGELVTYLLKS